MAHHEHSDDQSQPIEISLTPDAEEAQPTEPLNITIVPDADIGVALNREADGGYTIFSRGAIENGGRIVQGEVAIRIPSPVTETSVQDEMPQRGAEYQQRCRRLLQSKLAALQRNRRRNPEMKNLSSSGML